MTNSKDTVTSKLAAEMLDVTPRTIQLWADSGILASWKTPGGHRRFSLEVIERLADQLKRGNDLNIQNSQSPFNRISEDQGSQLPLRLLIIEDEPALIKLYQLNVNNWELPIHIDTAMDGYQGLIKIGSFQPHILVLDMNLPNIDGFSVVDSLREQNLTEQLMLFIVTALDQKEVKSKLKTINDLILLPKPIPFDTIRAAAQSLVNQFRRG